MCILWKNKNSSRIGLLASLTFTYPFDVSSKDKVSYQLHWKSDGEVDYGIATVTREDGSTEIYYAYPDST